MAEFPAPKQYDRVFTGERSISSDELLQAGIKSSRRRGIITVFTTAPEVGFAIQHAVELSGYRVAKARDAFKDARRAFNGLSEVYDWGEITEVAATEGAGAGTVKYFKWMPSQLPDFEDPSQILFAHIATGVPGNIPLEALGLTPNETAVLVGRVAGQFVDADAAGVQPGMKLRALGILSRATLARGSSILDAADVLSTELNSSQRRGRPDIPGRQ